MWDIMAKDKGEGFSSAAGLMRYFDSEDSKGIKLGPKVVVGLGIVFTAIILCLPVFWPMN